MQTPDLNLLRVFDTLIEMRSVTRAAKHLGLTQSAVSHALGRLRRELDDPLFLRSGSGLQPTTRAEEIAPGVREGLRQLRGALASPQFEPGQATRSFTIAAGAYFCALLVPLLIERLRREAPAVSLRIVPIAETLVTSLDRGTTDMVLGAYISMPARFVEEPLYQEEMVWVAAADHPLATAPFDPVGIANAPRVALSAGTPLDATQTAALNAIREQHFLTGPPGLGLPPPQDNAHTVYDSLTAIAIVARTDLVTLVPRRIATAAARHEDIAILSPITAAPSFGLSMFWHSKQQGDAGLAWLRAMIRLSTQW